MTTVCQEYSWIWEPSHNLGGLCPPPPQPGTATAIARYLLSSCVHVCLLVSHKPVIVSKQLDESSWVFWHGSGFLSPILGCCLRKFGYLGNITLLPSGTLSQTLDSENFATASRSRCQRHSSSSSTVELVDDIYTTVDESWLFTTGRSAVTL